MPTEINRFVIYEPTMLVALDLEGCLHEHDPDAEIMLASSLVEANRAIVKGGVTLAVLHAGHVDVDAVGVAILLIGDAAEEQPGAWQVLRRPFGAEDVVAAVASLGIRRSCCMPARSLQNLPGTTAPIAAFVR